MCPRGIVCRTKWQILIFITHFSLYLSLSLLCVSASSALGPWDTVSCCLKHRTQFHRHRGPFLGCTIFKMVPEWIEGTGDNLWLNINMKVQFEEKSPLDLSVSIKLNEVNPVRSSSNLNVISGSANSEMKAKIQNCPSLLGHSVSLNWINKQIQLSNCPEYRCPVPACSLCRQTKKTSAGLL